MGIISKHNAEMNAWKKQEERRERRLRFIVDTCIIGVLILIFGSYGESVRISLVFLVILYFWFRSLSLQIISLHTYKCTLRKDIFIDAPEGYGFLYTPTGRKSVKRIAAIWQETRLPFVPYPDLNIEANPKGSEGNTLLAGKIKSVSWNHISGFICQAEDIDLTGESEQMIATTLQHLIEDQGWQFGYHSKEVEDMLKDH